MATGADSAISSSEPRTDERRTEHALRASTSRGWRQRLQPLAVHLVDRHWYALAATPAQRSGNRAGNQITVEER